MTGAAWAMGQRLLTTATLLLFVASPAWAHGGEDHSHEAPAKPAATLQQADTSVTRSTTSDQYELVLTVDAAATGATRHVRLYLSDYATNAPIGDATLAIDWGDDVQTSITPTEQPGIYAGEVTFPKVGSYSPLVTVEAASGDDLLTLDPLPVSPPGTPNGSDPIPWAYAGGIGAAIAALVWRLTRRSRSASQSRPEVTP